MKISRYELFCKLLMLEVEITVSAFNITENHIFKTCYGDICKAVNALRDYARIWRWRV